MRRIIITAIVAVIIIATAGGTKMMAMPYWRYYRVDAKLNDSCCLDLTISNSCGGLDSPFNVFVQKKNSAGAWENVVAPAPVYSETNTNPTTVTICPEPGEDIEWKVFVDVTSTSPIPPNPDYWPISSGKMTAAEIAECEAGLIDPDSCYNISGCQGVDWQTASATVTIPQYPNCPFTYEYQYRKCGGEVQVKGGNISFYVNQYSQKDGDCSDLWLNMTYKNPQTEDWRDRIPIQDSVENLFKRAFAEFADGVFEEMITSTPENWREMFYNCDNPPPIISNSLVTYSEASCVSTYAAAYAGNSFLNARIMFGKQECDANSCCRTERTYCYDTEKQEIITNVFYSESATPCSAQPIPHVDFTGALFYFQTECKSDCGPIVESIAIPLPVDPIDIEGGDDNEN
jgi:hypothetical protein